MFSIYIRTRDKRRRGKCPFHEGFKPIECCFHFVTRAKYSIRWDPRNAVATCHGCNMRYEYDPHFAIAWFISEYGQEAYDVLIRDGNKISKFTSDDLRTIRERTRLMIERVCLDEGVESRGGYHG